MQCSRLRTLCGLVLAVPFAAIAGTPSSGTLSQVQPTLTYTYGPNSTPNQTGNCQEPLQPCDRYDLSVELPDTFATSYPSAVLRIETAWPDSPDNYYTRLVDSRDQEIGNSGGQPVGASKPMRVIEVPAGAGARQLHVLIYPSEVSGTTVTTTIRLLPGPPAPADADGDGVNDANDLCSMTAPGVPVDGTGCPLQGGFPASCTAPGLLLLTDPAGDNFDKTPGSDLLAIRIQQPAQVPAGDRMDNQLLRFRIETDGEASLTPSRVWFVSFQTPGKIMGVRMTGDARGNPVFQFYDVTDFGTGNFTGGWAEAVRPADLSSSYDRNTGTITIAVKATDLGLTAPGQNLEAFNAGVVDPVQTESFTTYVTNDGVTDYELRRSTVSYALHDNRICGGPRLQPIAPPPPPSGLTPRFQTHVSPATLGNQAGEPSVGFNPLTKRTMFISYTQALRETYPELSDLRDIAGNPLPMACDATWEDKSGTLTKVNSLDPVLFTDQMTGRTFNSQLSGDNSLMEYTDDDGENWSPAQVGPPNGGADHQTVATGVYPAGQVPLNARWPATGPKRAVYYCSHSVASAFCSRSDDGGLTFGPGFTFKNPDCGVGALHGRAKVAPDGTLYLPDSSKCIVSASPEIHVVAFVSADAGKTFAVSPIRQSTNGYINDPSIGIATDGTAYLCYGNRDGTVHVAVSRDKGVTWAGGQDIGATDGVVDTRFPQMIAGDPDRAACAFLGTKTAGNSSSLDFKGVWHGYIATTYDGGQNWHLINATPNDPVQGHGGISPSGINRNLLDFNDLQVDDEGRTLFAFADGCVSGCVKDSSANSFAAKATIVRQTGGRTLFAKFDDISSLSPVPRYNTTTPITPAAACARQDISTRTRTPAQANVVWNAPDTGGSPITHYKVYRSLAPRGPFTLLGDTGTRTRYTDTTASPSVDKYYYRIETENALGLAPVSNIIELPITSEVVNTCALPGEIVIQDATGDGAGDDTDIVYLGVAEPEAIADSFIFTLKIAKFTTGQPPADSFYPVLFPAQDNLYIALDATQGAPKFTHGTYQDLTAGALTFTENGRLDSRSAYGADGTIRMIVPRSLFGDPAPEAILSGFDVRTRLGGQSAASRDTAGPADYTVRGSAICTDPGIVIAELSATANHGTAPADITFTLSGNQSKGKRLQSYSILFGDEQGANPAPTTGSFGGQSSFHLPHIYHSPGVFRARLMVTDEAGTASTNLAEQTITVVGTGIASSTPRESNNRLGGALSSLSLLALCLLGGLSLSRARGKSVKH